MDPSHSIFRLLDLLYRRVVFRLLDLLYLRVVFRLLNLLYLRVVSGEILAGTEVPGGAGGRGRQYLSLYTVTTRMISALRWAVMTATVTFR